MELDVFDRKILAQIQRNNRQTAAELADKVGLSASACHRRLQRLREGRVIAADIAVIDPAAVGRRVTMIVTVTLEREQSDVIAEFKRATRESVEIMQCYYVTGPSDFVMILTAKSMEAYDAFVERFLFANRNVRRFETYVVMDRVKVGFDLPIDTQP
ncbi:Lrp/AsnC family transcriptional regulator [Histidinibacterium lentulum]|uniref:Lrp/AsnC family transcriptional regulator n=1 Tax=Histidinibacterium lentulum TaxID=2480588 RepID=A0A3N2QR68_9RHOB|nr:Lrp/AsnC family transcriptional regulator [Histidinibacterium lentulum]ROT97694.1 Lrp/AsnC family transcriptional regulator [Histidinibacterium lentulum]